MVAIALAVMALAVVWSTLPEMLFMLFVCYVLSGYVIATWEAVKRKGGSGLPPTAAP